jgi:uncharacterized membrane protein
MLGAGVLLFVSAHWDEIDAGARMAVVLAMVAAFHAGGAAVAGRFENLSVALHTVGTAALGAGIALAGQIYHLAEHWPAAVLMWAAGAAVAWLLLRHWTQAAFVAILVPYWLSGEWFVWVTENRTDFTGPYMAPVAAGVCGLSLTYLSARRGVNDSALRKVLAWLGGIALLPSAAVTAFQWTAKTPPLEMTVAGWSVAALAPLALAVAIRGRLALWNGGAILWCLLLSMLSHGRGEHIPVYAWCAVGSVGLAWWGVREARAERINLAMAGFAATLLAFYFSDVMDKMGRSASLILLGLLFLSGGWLLERTRRRLLSQIRPEAL